MSKKLHSEVVSSGSDSEVESGQIGSTNHGLSWLLKFQKEDEQTVLKKAIKLSKVSNNIFFFFWTCLSFRVYFCALKLVTDLTHT